MSEPVRCPACGGLNPPGADWCGQCFKRLTAPPPPPAPRPPSVEPQETTAPPSSGAPQATTPEPSQPAGAEPTQRGAFTVAGEHITWTCSRCDTDNELAETHCVVCGTSFADSMRPPEQDRPARDPGTVTLFSLFLPGAGHAYLGLWGQAVARAILSIYVVAVALAVAIGSGPTGANGLAIIYGIVAFALWLIAAHDAYREASRDSGAVILKQTRHYLFLVIGLLILPIALLIPQLGNLGG